VKNGAWFLVKCIFNTMNTLDQPLSDAHADVADSSTSDMRRKRVMLIEDEGAHRLVLLQKLRTAGFDVDVASNGHVALEKLRSGSPDAIFMDLLLSYVKGVDVIKAARRTEFANRPIYVCTSAAHMKAWSRRGTKAGATKIFDRASTPIDTIVAEVAAALMTSDAAPEPTYTFARHNAQSKTDVAELDKTVPAQCSHNHSPAVKPPAQQLNLVQRMVQALGLGRTDQGLSQGAASASLATPELSSPGVFGDLIEDELSAGVVSLSSELDNYSDEADPSQQESRITLPTGQRVAVLTLDETAKILSVNETCVTMFGWDDSALVGQNLKVLLKEDQAPALQEHLGKVLRKQPTEDHNSLLCPLHLVGRRKDGREFPVSLTTLTWLSDTTLTRRADASHFSWTACIRDLEAAANSQASAVTGLETVNQNQAEPSMTLIGGGLELEDAHPGLQKANQNLQKRLQDISVEAARHREELTKREKEREDLSARIFTSEIELKQARTELEQESAERKELEQKVRDLAATTADLERQLAERRQSEEDLLNRARQFREQRDEVKAVADSTEAACQQEAARAHRFQEDLAGLQRAYDELQGKLTTEQQAAAESKRQTGALESLLQERAAEVERVKTDLENQIAERKRLEVEWCEKFHNAETLTQKLEAAWREEADRSKTFEERLRTLCNNLRVEQSERTKRFDGEVAGLRQVRDELQSKLTAEHQVAAESTLRAEQLETRLRDSTAEVERVKAELEKQTSEQDRLQSEWREKLNTAEALTNKLEAAWVEAEERNRRFEEELAGLRQVRDELQGKLLAEHQAAAESRRRNDQLAIRVIENAAELERIKAELEKAGRNEHVEERLNTLQQLRDELGSKLTAEQQVAAESKQRSDEFEARLRQNTAELDRIKAEAEKYAEQQARLESELQAQRNAAKAAVEQAEAALNEKVAQCSQFESELSSLRQVRDELNGKLMAEEQAAAESRRRNEELEKQLRDNAAELERVKMDSDKQAEAQARLESELRTQLNAAKAAAEQAEAALKKETARNNSFDERVQIFGSSLKQEQVETIERFAKELASLQQVRDELSNKLTLEQQVATESRQRAEDFEKRLRESTGEVESAQAKLARHEQDRGRLEAEVQAQLNAAKAATLKAEAAWLEESERSSRFQGELASIRQERDELHGKLTAEQQVATESSQRSEQFETRLRDTTAELERIKADAHTYAEEKARLESELHAQLDATKTAAARAEAALNEKLAQCNQFESELASLRLVRDELTGKLTDEQQAATRSKHSSEELERQLRENTAELERVKAEAHKHADERARLESEQHTQLLATKAAAEQAQATLNEKLAQCSQFESELAGLRQVRDELNGKLTQEQQVAAESRHRSEELEGRLRENAAELERMKAEAHKQAAEQAHLESELRTQLNAAKAAVEEAQTALTLKVAQCNQFENELAGLRQAREELNGKLTSEQQVAEELRHQSAELVNQLRDTAAQLEHLKAELERQAAQHARSESDWREQLTAVQTVAANRQEALKEGERRYRHLERSLANLRNERHQLCERFKAEHQAGAKSKRRIKELEKRLHERTLGLQDAKAQLEAQALERGHLESEWRTQLETAQATAGQKLETLRQEREALAAELAAERQAATESTHRSQEFENQLRESAAELERLKTEMDQYVQERDRRESEYRNFTDTKEALGMELRALRENELARGVEITELEGRLREGMASLARLTSELSTERGERCRTEQRAAALAAQSQEFHEKLQRQLESEQASEYRIAELMQQLRQHEEVVTRVNADLQREMTERQSAEEQLRATGDISAQLRNHLSLLDEARQIFARREGELEARLQSSLNAMRDTEASREKEVNERRRLEEALQAAQRECQSQGESNAIELARLQSAMQVEQLERKRLEADIIQSRYSSVDSTRVGRAMVSSFRNRMRQLVDNLMESTHGLLGVKSEEEQKKLIEAVLENALLIQTNLRESGRINASSARSGGESQSSSEDPSSAGTGSDQANTGVQR
jgi:PAS domain S-box-containing protein